MISKAIVVFTSVLFLSGALRSAQPTDTSPKEAPEPSSFVEHGGARIPLYTLSQIRPSNLVQPEYPKEEKEKKLVGKAVIRVFVTREGKIAELEIRTSEPSSSIGDSAKKAVSQWRFPAVTRGGAGLSYAIDVPVIFVPEGTPPL